MAAIVVFGGAGFIGSHLIQRLVRENRGTVYSVDIREPKIRIEGAVYLKQDVRNLSSFDIAEDIGIIFNFAAVHTTPGHPDHEYYETNIRGATEITAFARRRNIRTIVFTSSISVYGPGEETKTETTPPAPVSAYGWSKWLAEGIHRSWLDEAGDRHLVICRPAVIFGHAEGGNFTRMAALLRHGFFIYPGRTDTIKSCFYVEDLLDALLYASGLQQPYVLFNGAYPDRYTIQQIVGALKASHFPKAREFMVPKWIVMLAASCLKPFSALGLGIHPDRVLKLIRSTDIMPDWLIAQGVAKQGGLPSAIERWNRESNGALN